MRVTFNRQQYETDDNSPRMAETFYSVLGVDPEADTETIQTAYRELVKTHHPDVSDADDAVEEFKRITQARDILVDDTSRKQYDRVGHNTYVRRYMDGNAWTVDHNAQSTTRSRSTAGSTDTGPSTATDNTTRSSTNARRTAGGQTGHSGSRSGPRETRDRASETAHDYDRYRSQYSTAGTHGSRRYDGNWQDRSWTDDFDWSPDEKSSTTGGTARTDATDRARADGWQAARTTANGYRPSGHDVGGTAGQSSSGAGGIQPALKSIGPWLAFHFVFLMSAFVTILLLMRWEASVPTVFISLVLLGGAVFFSVLHMVSRIYS